MEAATETSALPQLPPGEKAGHLSASTRCNLPPAVTDEQWNAARQEMVDLSSQVRKNDVRTAQLLATLNARKDLVEAAGGWDQLLWREFHINRRQAKKYIRYATLLVKYPKLSTELAEIGITRAELVARAKPQGTKEMSKLLKVAAKAATCGQLEMKLFGLRIPAKPSGMPSVIVKDDTISIKFVESLSEDQRDELRRQVEELVSRYCGTLDPQEPAWSGCGDDPRA